MSSLGKSWRGCEIYSQGAVMPKPLSNAVPTFFDLTMSKGTPTYRLAFDTGFLLSLFGPKQTSAFTHNTGLLKAGPCQDISSTTMDYCATVKMSSGSYFTVSILFGVLLGIYLVTCQPVLQKPLYHVVN
jgi:hypothetical protein